MYWHWLVLKEEPMKWWEKRVTEVVKKGQNLIQTLNFKVYFNEDNRMFRKWERNYFPFNYLQPISHSHRLRISVAFPLFSYKFNVQITLNGRLTRAEINYMSTLDTCLNIKIHSFRFIGQSVFEIYIYIFTWSFLNTINSKKEEEN